MAKTPDAVRDLLMAVWAPARAQAEADAARLAELMRADGVNGPLEPWDWRYYAAKREAARARHRPGDAEALPRARQHPRRRLRRRRPALRAHASTPIEAELYHPDARAWEVRRGDRHMGVFIGDYFARPSKRSGAWCTTFRDQRRLDGEVRPIAVNVCNFAKAPAGEPNLLTFDDAHTLFHEMGHALHVLLSDVTYDFISGTSVARDFVELPSQLFEHWLETPEVLRGPCPPCRDRGADAARPDGPADRGAELRPWASPRSSISPRRSSTSTSTSAPPPADPMAAQAATLARGRHAGGDRDAARHAALPARLRRRRLLGRLLFLHVVGGDGRRRLRRLPRDRRRLRPGDRARGSSERSSRAGGSRDEAELYRAFRGRMPGVEALLEQRGLTAA